MSEFGKDILKLYHLITIESFLGEKKVRTLVVDITDGKIETHTKEGSMTEVKIEAKGILMDWKE